MCGPRQLLFFQGGPDMPKGWTPLIAFMEQILSQVTPMRLPVPCLTLSPSSSLPYACVTCCPAAAAWHTEQTAPHWRTCLCIFPVSTFCPLKGTMQQHHTNGLTYEIQVINAFLALWKTSHQLSNSENVFRGPKLKLQWKIHSSAEHRQNVCKQVNQIFTDGL